VFYGTKWEYVCRPERGDDVVITLIHTIEDALCPLIIVNRTIGDDNDVINVEHAFYIHNDSAPLWFARHAGQCGWFSENKLVELNCLWGKFYSQESLSCTSGTHL
jgi:hypothetical protein